MSRPIANSGFYGLRGVGHLWLEPNYNVYEFQHQTRTVYHSGLDSLIEYRQVPRETTNLGWSAMVHRDIAEQKTLAGNRATLWPSVAEDIVFTERFTPADVGATFWSFLLALYDVYQRGVDWVGGERLTWAPKDRTPIIFPVDLIDLQVDGENFTMTWDGRDPASVSIIASCPGRPGYDIATVKEVVVRWKLRVEAAPSASLSIFGGSSTNETGQFDPE